MEGITGDKKQGTSSFGKKVKDHALLAGGAEVQELETRSAPMDDFGGSGPTVVLRRFQYQLPPKVKYSAKDILDHHTPRIIPFLWKDGLEQIGEPKVVFGKKGKFDIYITATPRRGQLLHDKPLSLKEAMHATANS